MATRFLVDLNNPWWDAEEHLSEYDPDGCMMLLAAIVRRWWLDGLLQPNLLIDLADWIGEDVQILQDNRPVKFYARSSMFLES